MSQISYTEFTSINDIPEVVFEELGCANSFYFSKPFLTAFESQNNHIKYHYFLLSAHKNLIAIAIIQRLEISLGKVTEQLHPIHKVVEKLRYSFLSKKTTTTICGNIFLSGNYGVFIKNHLYDRDVFSKLAEILIKNKNTKKSKLLFLKDFNSLQNQAASVTENYFFQSFAVEPNMIIDIRWNSFEEYKKVLKSKYRVKINKADTSSASLKITTLSAQEIRSHSVRLQELYENVTNKANFNTAILNVEMYAVLKERFRESVLFNIYKKQDTIVGFLTAFHVDVSLDAHFIGLDYEYNKTDSIYPRMLNDYIRIGIERKVKKINLGRTASEIKSSLGAVPEHLRCYVKHRRTLPNLFFKPILKHIKMTEYKQHFPLKK